MNLRKNIAEALRQAEIEDTKVTLPILRLINTVIIDRDNRARADGIVEGVSNRIIYEVLIKMLEQKTTNYKNHEKQGEIELATQEKGRVMAALKENYSWGQMDFKSAHARVVEKLC